MLPETARPNDFVEVVDDDHKYFGFIGIIKELRYDTVIVDIFGKDVELAKSQVKMMARIGSRAHQSLMTAIKEREVNSLTMDDYDDLINFAIDMQDWEYATELISRKRSFEK